MHQVFSTMTDSSDPKYHSQEYIRHIASLKQQLIDFSTSTTTEAIGSSLSSDILKLFKLATLIYLERQSSSFSGVSEEIESWCNEAFQLLTELKDFNQPFPLFILGCEARTDEQRDVVLELISRTDLITHSKNLQYVAHITKSVWVQDDLADETIDYGRKLDRMLSSMRVCPSFA